LHDLADEPFRCVDLNVVQVNDLVGDTTGITDAFFTFMPAALHDRLQKRGLADAAIALKVEKVSTTLPEVLPGLLQKAMATHEGNATGT
jgi:hypothetical protein